MWPSDLKKQAKNMKVIISLMIKAGEQCESEEVEELARELESLAGSIVTDMQENGIWVGIVSGSDTHIIEGDFGERE